MSRIRILPYKQGSRSAKALAAALGGKVLRLENSTFKPKEGDTIINWGNSRGLPTPALPTYTYLNPHDDVVRASNKLTFFNTIQENNLEAIVPRFWTDRNEIPDETYPIVCRRVLNGHSGDGIHIADSSDGLVVAPLYVQYVKKKEEYRVHCIKNGPTTEGGEHHPSAFLVQRKARRNGYENPNWQVRNHANGFVYVRNDVNPPASVLEVALKAFGATGLDFGAVDVIWNAQQERAYVLEINTAPGLEGTTVDDYANALKGMING